MVARNRQRLRFGQYVALRNSLKQYSANCRFGKWLCTAGNDQNYLFESKQLNADCVYEESAKTRHIVDLQD